MSTYFRYFRCTAGPLHERFLAQLAARKVEVSKITAFQKKTGIQIFGREDYTIGGCVPPAPIDGKVWGKPDRAGHRLPQKKTEEGKAMQAQLNSLPQRLPKIEQPLLDHGFDSFFLGDAIGGRFPAYGPTVTGPLKDGSFYVRLPWADEKKSVLTKYKRDRKAGTHCCARYDHLLTPIPAELVEVKEWEMLKAFDEHNAAIEKPKKKRA